MKTEQLILVTSIEAQADLSKNLFIGFDGNLCATTEKALGVSNADTLSGEMLPVVTSGIALIKSGEALAVGDPLISGIDSKAYLASNIYLGWPLGSTPVVGDASAPTTSITGSVLSQAINGYALDAASAADELIRIKLI